MEHQLTVDGDSPLKWRGGVFTQFNNPKVSLEGSTRRPGCPTLVRVFHS